MPAAEQKPHATVLLPSDPRAFFAIRVFVSHPLKQK